MVNALHTASLVMRLARPARTLPGAAFGGFGDAFGNKRVDGFCPAHRAVQLAYWGIFDFVGIIIRGNIGVMDDAGFAVV